MIFILIYFKPGIISVGPQYSLYKCTCCVWVNVDGQGHRIIKFFRFNTRACTWLLFSAGDDLLYDSGRTSPDDDEASRKWSLSAGVLGRVVAFVSRG